MLVALNDSWKIPVGYFLLDGLSGIEKAELVKKCLVFIHESGVIVSSVTFDGAPANFTMASHLGANFANLQNIISYFDHPITDDKVFIFPDPSHMIKLVRNTFGSQKFITDRENNIIDWNYLVKLLQRQEFEGLHLGIKLRIRHLHWTQEKMKVKIATQTLSKSVADALMYLSQDLKAAEFVDSASTANFEEHFNNIFDIFNSRNKFAKYAYKRPLSPATENFVFSSLDDMAQYIKGLKLGNTPIVRSSRKTGFIGFLICINSLKDFYKTFVL